MRIMAQLAMVMNLDKCIGCHTCSVTCKNAVSYTHLTLPTNREV